MQAITQLLATNISKHKAKTLSLMFSVTASTPTNMLQGLRVVDSQALEDCGGVFDTIISTKTICFGHLRIF